MLGGCETGGWPAVEGSSEPVRRPGPRWIGRVSGLRGSKGGSVLANEGSEGRGVHKLKGQAVVEDCVG